MPAQSLGGYRLLHLRRGYSLDVLTALSQLVLEAIASLRARWAAIGFLILAAVVVLVLVVAG